MALSRNYLFIYCNSHRCQLQLAATVSYCAVFLEYSVYDLADAYKDVHQWRGNLRNCRLPIGSRCELVVDSDRINTRIQVLGSPDDGTRWYLPADVQSLVQLIVLSSV
jgi:hypothetical protein